MFFTNSDELQKKFPTQKDKAQMCHTLTSSIGLPITITIKLFFVFQPFDQFYLTPKQLRKKNLSLKKTEILRIVPLFEFS